MCMNHHHHHHHRLAATARRRWRCSPRPLHVLRLHHGHPDAPLQIGPLRWAFLLSPPGPLAASYHTVDDDKLVCPAFVTQPCPDYVMPSRALQPTSTSRSTCESCTIATVNVNTLLTNETAMEEGLQVPR